MAEHRLLLREAETDAEVEWLAGKPKILSEDDARRLFLRSSTLVAVRRATGDPMSIEWIPPAARDDYWRGRIAGNYDYPGTPMSATPDGLTYRGRSYRDSSNRRLLLLEAFC